MGCVAAFTAFLCSSAEFYNCLVQQLYARPYPPRNDNDDCGMRGGGDLWCDPKLQQGGAVHSTESTSHSSGERRDGRDRRACALYVAAALCTSSPSPCVVGFVHSMPWPSDAKVVSHAAHCS